MTRAAEAIGLTPSAVSSSIKALENYHGVRLFDRIGRRIALTQEGRLFLLEARATLARVQAASLMLSELGGLARGTIDIFASQTIATYWLPPRLMAFHEAYPSIELRLNVGNTRNVAEAVLAGRAELGFVEGAIDEPALHVAHIAEDDLVVVVPPHHPLATQADVSARMLVDETRWIVREEGSGTRSVFERSLADMLEQAPVLDIALVLPSNEAVLSAVLAGNCATAVSRLAAEPFLQTGALTTVDIALPPRKFMSLRHKERHHSLAMRELEASCLDYPAGSRQATAAATDIEATAPENVTFLPQSEKNGLRLLNGLHCNRYS